jgi:tetrapyrrole methylase family protein/MazG family protein
VSRGRVVVVGLGPAGIELLAPAALDRLRGPAPVRLRTRVHPAAEALGDLASFDGLYESAERIEDVYEGIVDELVALAEAHGEVVYAVPGSPLVAERTVELLRTRSEVDLTVMPALSFIDLAWAALGVDPLATEARLVDATALGSRLRGPGPILLTQCHAPQVLSEVKLSIDADLLESPPRAILLHHLGLDDERIEEVSVDELDRIGGVDHLTSVYLPELRTVGPAAEDLVDLMARLRAECPWDQRQTHGSLTRHLLEEAYEALDALEHLSTALDSDEGVDAAYAHVEEELGDLVFQVVFHAHLAAEEGRFDLTRVLDAVQAKLIGRHPHVFGDVVAETPDAVAANWEDLKRAEKGRASVTEGIPDALPALMRYVKLRRKAAAIGIGEPDVGELVEEVRASLEALDTGVGRADDATGSSDGPGAGAVADALAAVAEIARLRGVDPEMALRRRADALRDEIIAVEAASEPPA